MATLAWLLLKHAHTFTPTQRHTSACEYTLNRDGNIPISVWKKKKLLRVKSMDLVQNNKWTWEQCRGKQSTEASCCWEHTQPARLGDKVKRMRRGHVSLAIQNNAKIVNVTPSLVWQHKIDWLSLSTPSYFSVPVKRFEQIATSQTTAKSLQTCSLWLQS